jgi:hypothetical protein
VCNWNIFSARMNHMHTQTHKTHHNPNLGETTTFPLIVFFMLDHRGCTQMSFCPRIPKSRLLKFLKLRFSQLWRPITFCACLQLKWGLKKSCSLHWDLSNNMWHVTCTKVNQGNFWFLVVRSQIGILTLNISFGHILCFEY